MWREIVEKLDGKRGRIEGVEIVTEKIRHTHTPSPPYTQTHTHTHTHLSLCQPNTVQAIDDPI